VYILILRYIPLEGLFTHAFLYKIPFCLTGGQISVQFIGVKDLHLNHPTLIARGYLSGGTPQTALAPLLKERGYFIRSLTFD
jgi:hypothetical protein